MLFSPALICTPFQICVHMQSMRGVLKVNPYNEQMQTKVNKALQAYANINPRMAALTAEKFGTDNLVRFVLERQIDVTIQGHRLRLYDVL